jgi:hypothetical protein
LKYFKVMANSRPKTDNIFLRHFNKNYQSYQECN